MRISPLASTAGAAATAWVLRRAAAYRRLGVPLTPHERDDLARRAGFGPDLLDRVRVARVPVIANPTVLRPAIRAGWAPPMDLRRLSGMVFIDVVALAEPAWRSPDVLLHECVHVAQYAEMGTRRFLTAYTQSWLDEGRDYWSIVFERQAYALTRRARAGGVDAPAEVRALARELGLAP